MVKCKLIFQKKNFSQYYFIFIIHLDYVIAWEEEINNSNTNTMEYIKNENYRKRFEENLEKMSVEMERVSGL